MSDQLDMGGGFSPIKMGIVAGVFAVAGTVAFSFISASAPSKHNQAAAATTTSSAAATPAASDGSGAANPAQTATDANNAQNKPMSSTTAAAAPTAQPAQSASASSIAPVSAASDTASATVNVAAPSSSGPVATKAESSKAPGAARPDDALTAMASDSSAAVADSEDAVAAPAKHKGVSPAKHHRPIATPPPPATAVLHEWWKTSDTAAFGVQFVGQAAESNSLVILFSKPIDPSAVGDKVRVLSADGKAMDLNWQRGNNPQVLVQNDLPPGRYTVMLDPATASMTGQNLGAPLSGPVFIQ